MSLIFPGLLSFVPTLELPTMPHFYSSLAPFSLLFLILCIYVCECVHVKPERELDALELRLGTGGCELPSVGAKAENIFNHLAVFQHSLVIL